MTDFAAHLERASAIVRTWPKWKRNLLGRTEARGAKEDDMSDSELYEQIARDQSWPNGPADAAVLRAERDAARAEADRQQARAEAAEARCEKWSDLATEVSKRADARIMSLCEATGAEPDGDGWWLPYFHADGTHEMLPPQEWVQRRKAAAVRIRGIEAERVEAIERAREQDAVKSQLEQQIGTLRAACAAKDAALNGVVGFAVCSKCSADEMCENCADEYAGLLDAAQAAIAYTPDAGRDYVPREELKAAQNRICEADAEVDRTLSELNRVVTLHMDSLAENIAALKEQHAEVRNLKAELARVQAEAAAMMKCISDAVHASYTGDSDDVRAELLPAIETTAGLNLLERLDKAEAALHAIEDALVKTGTSPEPIDGDWKQAINALIDWHVRVSHDPRVNGSEQAGAE